MPTFNEQRTLVRKLIAAEAGDGLDLAGAEAAHHEAHLLTTLAANATETSQANVLLQKGVALVVAAGGTHGESPTPPPVAPGGVRMDAVASVADIPHGSQGADAWNGTAAADDFDGDGGNDTLTGGAGDDRLWGAMGNDLLRGGDGADLLVGGFGADTMEGGAGNDTLLSRADAGEPDITQNSTNAGPRVERLTENLGYDTDFKTQPHNDVLTGGAGKDTFQFETMIGTKPNQIETQLRPDGDVDWSSIAMAKNGTLHYHWIDSVGDDTITDFNRAEGDKISLMGHTVDVARIDFDGTNSVIHLVSRSRTADAVRLAHEGDDLGSITVLNAQVALADISVEPKPMFGSFVKATDPGVDARRNPFVLDDGGVLPGVGLPGEDPWMM